MANPPKDTYFESGSLAKPPKFNVDNFSLWKSRMELFLSGSDPQIPYFLEHGSYVPTSIIPFVATTTTSPAVPKRTFIKLVSNLTEEDKRLVNVDTKARSLIAMSLPNEVFHSISKLKIAKEIWDTLCIQYEGVDALFESRNIHLIRQYEKFIASKGETLAQTHQRFNCLLIDLKTYDVVYSNSQVITKFMEALPEYWENYTMCPKMSKDIKTITLSELYGMTLNHEQTKSLKTNLIRDTKDAAKGTSLALVSDAPQPSQSISRNLAEKETIGKGHFATECRYKKNQFTETSTPASNDGKYQKLKAKYRKLKFERKGKGLITEGKSWDESSDESSDEEDTSELEDIPEEEVPATPASTSALSLAQVTTPSPSDTMTAMDALTIDLYNALNGKSSAEKVNFDLRTELKECHEKLKELAVFEANYKDQVHANQVLCIEREQAIAEREKVLAELNSEKVAVKSWADASEKSSSSISKDEASTSVQPPKNSKGKNHPNHPPKPKKQNHKTPKVLGGGPSGSGSKKSVQSPTPRIKIDLKTKPQEKTPIPPQTRDIGILGPGPAHLNKCPHATKAEKAVKVKKCPKANKSAKGKKPLIAETVIISDPTNTETSIKTDDVASTSTVLVVYEDPKSSVIYKKGIWYLDSGCSKHMTGNKHVLVDYKEEAGPSVKFGGEGRDITKGYGTLTNGKTTFRMVFYVEGLTHNLLSISQLCDKDHKVSFSKKSCKVKNRHKKIILRGQRSHDVYVINMDMSTEHVCFMSRDSSEINWLWHKRLSHLNFKTINQLSVSNLVKGLPENSFAKEYLCATCEKGKQTRASFKSKKVSTINSPLHLLHMDLFGPVFFLRAKSETPQLIISFILRMEKYNQITFRSIRSDHGTEFKNSVLDEFLVSKGISQNFSSVRTPQQNRAEAVNTACYTQNRSLIMKRFKKTAYELIRGRKSNIEYFHIFGCNCYIKNDRDALGKFDAKADDGFLVGYSTISYRVFNKRRQTIEETIHCLHSSDGKV
ncbi:hypothetical protein OSB04_031894 [Centaurea solstitialis]|uniref:Integrase catalytic domain-containing protein n=1 Tax=Centaurea solstitialis TaxID=347529 RepID=A0AA38SNK0_9ASTR|nr:hypothetical protein OSB04_031894 [Centaurea solstitialis]